MNPFMFTVPQNILFGNDSLSRLPELLDKCGMQNVLLISDPNLKDIGIVDKVQNLIRESGANCNAFTNVEANPSIQTVESATDFYRACNSDGILALGGGSAMDTAKAVGVLAKYGGKIIGYEGADKVPGPIIPVIAIPTTAGTGSEVTAFSVITDTVRNYKMTVFSYELIPRYALLDPTLIHSVPFSVAAACGMDALIHAIEAYLSRNASPFSDAMAEKAMELIGKHIRAYCADRGNKKAAEQMLAGSMFAGIAFSWARLGNVHAMSHPVSAIYHVPHGVANAILLPYILEYNALADEGRYEKIYRFICQGSHLKTGFTSADLVDEIRKLNYALGIPARLSEAGVTEERIPQMAQDASLSGNVAANPRQTRVRDLEMLYQAAL